MVLDTSAILAVLLEEPEAAQLVHFIGEDRIRLCSAVSFVEASIVLRNRKGERGRQKLDQFLRRARVQITAVDVKQAEVAREAYEKFGKGKHPAGLNLGDCFSYALAKTTNEPLLFKGEDFVKTDVVSVP
ncbi:type II toxin-antitoxin system VapC family toxin [Alloacidobacterium dinghuense]|uniref:Ribonuclease VapC n=1 Tax=Alloacidobacterium dinghuense TaxID=2763107 RepID=A0A7G8BIA9_9BACT|nr:type II toxin-antitoxin system VapC family toxin [Alloacidobacterium dinghuense]QNI32279.1 type II toxin-antitoxin system VapC family toxin [Alloacidobacterium dinghuense]